MEDILLEILHDMRAEREGRLDDIPGLAPSDEKYLETLIRAHNQNLPAEQRHHSKKRLLPFYLRVKDTQPQRWESWGVTPELEQQLIALLRVKPRRTASGVATITAITKPWKCGSACLYCPNDVRMPKSYMSDEPACQRAERNCFDPYLQVTSRLRALAHMGHVTDKVELIVLGSTWTDYPEAYQIWFVEELFRALNDAGVRLAEPLDLTARDGAESAHNTHVAPGPATTQAERNAANRRASYRRAGIPDNPEAALAFTAHAREGIASGRLTYNQAMSELYENGTAWSSVSAWQVSSWEALEAQQRINETAAHRAVGLVIETRPDAITPANLFAIRRLGCTKVQIGVQSLDERILRANHRGITTQTIERAFGMLRLFGFKIHAHFMANLHGATPASDKAEYRAFVTEAPYMPDEVKMYPCALIADTGLHRLYVEGSWKPYDERELMDVLVANTLATPPFVRISRMIRDFSAADIVDGNKKVNLRQMVEQRACEQGAIEEIRFREISTAEAPLDALSLVDYPYETAVSTEHFLQWITPEGAIAGFLRLSLPRRACVEALVQACEADGLACPLSSDAAMIREVHVYGKVAGLGSTSGSAQHTGLGKKLIARACDLARDAGYVRVNVISSVGTREYYRALGFADCGLYQQKELISEP